MKNLVFALTVCALGSVYAVPTVSNVTMERNDSTGLTIVNYTLSEAAIVTAVFTTNGVPVVTTCMSGQINCYMENSGTYKFCWMPREADGGLELEAEKLTVEVKAWTLQNPPSYLAIDLRTGRRAYYDSEGAIQEGVKAARYRRGDLLMRHIPAAGRTFRMGPQLDEYGANKNANVAEYSHYVSFTNDYYMGVFETTQWQFNYRYAKKEISTGPDYPIVNVGLEGHVRGWRDLNYKCRFPQNGRIIEPGMFMSNMRLYVGSSNEFTFDVPSEAEWEFAARAGADGATPGDEDASDATKLAAAVDAYAWYNGNSGGVVHEVGLKASNHWGLYDMQGNVEEFVLDTWDVNKNATLKTDLLVGKYWVEPAGAYATDDRNQTIIRGGRANLAAEYCRLSARSAINYSGSASATVGFRIWCAMPATSGAGKW